MEEETFGSSQDGWRTLYTGRPWACESLGGEFTFSVSSFHAFRDRNHFNVSSVHAFLPVFHVNHEFFFFSILIVVFLSFSSFVLGHKNDRQHRNNNLGYAVVILLLSHEWHHHHISCCMSCNVVASILRNTNFVTMNVLEILYNKMTTQLLQMTDSPSPYPETPDLPLPDMIGTSEFLTEDHRRMVRDSHNKYF